GTGTGAGTRTGTGTGTGTGTATGPGTGTGAGTATGTGTGTATGTETGPWTTGRCRQTRWGSTRSCGDCAPGWPMRMRGWAEGWSGFGERAATRCWVMRASSTTRGSGWGWGGARRFRR
ncbi:MAG: hypothetical protein JRH11_04465, partial [Deltaproteobacteria bacterium]|nr:hypothetical protein [Deltaproteobacteria bacterium]